MTKRLQVLLDDEELAQIRSVARQEGQSVAEWVRSALRRARTAGQAKSAGDKLAVLASATQHDFPSGPIEQLLDEIERGYRTTP